MDKDMEYCTLNNYEINKELCENILRRGWVEHSKR